MSSIANIIFCISPIILCWGAWILCLGLLLFFAWVVYVTGNYLYLQWKKQRESNKSSWEEYIAELEKRDTDTNQLQRKKWQNYIHILVLVSKDKLFPHLKNFKYHYLFTFLFASIALWYLEHADFTYYYIVGSFLGHVKDWFSGKIWVIFWTICLYAVTIFGLLYNHYKSDIISYRYIILPFITFVFLFHHRVMLWMQYFGLWNICMPAIAVPMFFLLLIELWKLRPRWTSKKPTYNGFSNDDIKDMHEDSLRKKYVETLMKKLNKTQFGKSAYSIAIIGRWGSGKTTFMNEMRNIAESENYRCIEFLPWQCENSNQIIEAFFDELKLSLSGENSKVSELIDQYAEALIATCDVPGFGILQSVHHFWQKRQSKSTATIKAELANLLCQLRKPIYVFIDDMDRLVGGEILEVIKLIRDTANFKNLIYVVPIDKNHVVEQLEESGIHDGKLFLEKIFCVEIPLPSVGTGEIMKTLSEELRWMSKRTGAFASMQSALSQDERDLVCSILRTYRGVKHFARQFAVTVDLLYGTKRTFEYKDIFFLELLRYVNPDLYGVLSNEPDLILQSNINNSNNGIARYVFDSSKVNESVKSIVQPIDESILKVLFPKIINRKNLICLYSYYFTYFTLESGGLIVSDEEFLALLQKPRGRKVSNGMRKEICGWFTRPIPKSQLSMQTQFMRYDYSHKNIDVASYIQAFFYWIEFASDAEVVKVVYHRICNINQYESKNHQKEVATKIKDGWLDLIEHLEPTEKHKRFIIASILSSECSYNGKTRNLMSYDSTVGPLLQKNFEYVLKSQKWSAQNVIQNDGNLLNLVALASIVTLNTGYGPNPEDLNPVAHTIISYFSQEGKKSVLDDKVKELIYTSLDNPITYTASVRNVFPTQGEDDHIIRDYIDNCFIKEKVLQKS